MWCVILNRWSQAASNHRPLLRLLINAAQHIHVRAGVYCMCVEESRRRQLTAALSTLWCSGAADRLTVWSGLSERCLRSAVSGHLSAVWLPCCWLKDCLLLWREGKEKMIFFSTSFKAGERVLRKCCCRQLQWEVFSGQSFHQLTIRFLIQVERKCNLTDSLEEPASRQHTLNSDVFS